MRWKSTSDFACGWIRGTNWMADAPVPMTAMRSPVRSWSWSHRAEWKTVPSKVSRPGRSGYFGSHSGPVPATRNCATTVPRFVCTVHRWVAPSHVASTTSAPVRTYGRRPNRSTTRCW